MGEWFKEGKDERAALRYLSNMFSSVDSSKKRQYIEMAIASYDDAYDETKRDFEGANNLKYFMRALLKNHAVNLKKYMQFRLKFNKGELNPNNPDYPDLIGSMLGLVMGFIEFGFVSPFFKEYATISEEIPSKQKEMFRSYIEIFNRIGKKKNNEFIAERILKIKKKHIRDLTKEQKESFDILIDELLK